MANNLTSERQQIIEKLQTLKWYSQTDQKIKDKLQNLPEDFNGFINDLANRSDEIGQVNIIKLKEIKQGNYLLIPIFLVRSLQTNEEFTYEFTTFKYGSSAGFRGIIFIEINGQIKFFILRYSHKFQVASSIYETIGSFFNLMFSTKNMLNLPNKIENSIKNLLDINSLNIKRYIDLGQMYSDTGMTNNHPSLYAAIIDGAEIKSLQKLEGKTLSTWATGSEITIQPIDQLPQFISRVDDSFFLACIARLVAIGIIKI